LSAIKGVSVNLKEAYLITFIASFCTLVIEIAAGRILAPFVGVSIYTWTSIIGVILAGISIGAYIGGKLGDRFPRITTVGWLLLLSGITTLTVIPLTDIVAAYQFPLSLLLRIIIVTLAIFFIPGCILGTLSPVVVKLALKDVEHAGNVVGKIYALSTLGAITGTFLTGFLLISWLGTRNTIIAIGTVPLFAASHSLFRKKNSVAIYLAVVAVSVACIHQFMWTLPAKANSYFYKESDYYTIKLSRVLSNDKKTVLEKVNLDNLTHSYVALQNPLHLEYEYEKIFVELLTWKFPRDARFKSLTIGGGGYTVPRGMEVYFPNAGIDVVEIDPEVTKTAYKYLGLPRNTRIRTFNMDGRWYVMNCREKYDIVFADAYNDVSVPYHLTTREFAEQLKAILKPGGLVVSNIIDHFHKGLFLPSYMKTMAAVFGEENVRLISPSADWKNIEMSTFVVVAGNGALDMTNLEDNLKMTRGQGAQSVVVPDELVKPFFHNRKAIIMTDNYAPVDNLIAPVFALRYAYKLKLRQQEQQQAK
jgi:predicted membrane-bound spermidine synthase